MIVRSAWTYSVLLVLAGCGEDAKPGQAPAERTDLSPTQRDAEVLGQAVFEMVDRAMDYRGSHRGRPAASLRQMGLDSLTPTLVYRLINVDREPVITVAFRRLDGHELAACRGDSQILEDAALHSGKFTVMCTTPSGAQRPIEVGGAAP